MSKKGRIFLSVVSSILLVVVALGLWSRLGPLGPGVSEALASNSGAQYQEENEPGTDHPDEARQFRALTLMDENGVIPPDGLIVADQQMDEMRAQADLSEQALTRGAWTWIGPGNIGGRIRSIIIHPTNANIMWAGSATGGIWKTTNGGVSWQILDDFMSNMAVSTMVIDPTNPLILYAGTGEGLNGERSETGTPQGAGVFKTTDGGTTWNQLSDTNTDQWYYVNRLAIHPTNPLILLAGTHSGVWKTVNGGASWTQTAITGFIADIDFNPSDGTKAVLGETWAGSFVARYSTDSGSTWSSPATFTSIGAGATNRRIEVAYAPSNPSTVYASVNINKGEIWKSTDGGATYLRRSTGTEFLGTQGGYDNIIWVDPTNANNLVVGGIDLWRSANGGSTLTKISQWNLAPASSAHADQHMIIEKPGFNGTTNTTVFFGNDGGVYRANDVYTVATNSGWTELNNNLGITQFYSGAGNATTGTIIGGTQDNGTLVYTPAGGTEGWIMPIGGDGGWSAADANDSNYFYGEYTFGQIHRNSAGGAPTSDYIYGVDTSWDGTDWITTYKPAPYLLADAKDEKTNFIAPFVLDPNNSNRLLVGGESLWRTNDVKATLTATTGPSWYAIKAPTTGAVDDNIKISAVVVAPGNSNIIWVGHSHGDVYKTINGTDTTPTWTKVDTGTPNLPNRYVTRITIDKNDNNKVYVTFGGFSADNVYVTTNGGTNWSDITGSGATGLPDLPVRSLVIHPNNSSYIYIGTELGIFASEDGGANWTLPHNGPTNTPVDELFWMGNKLVAATFGRGMFTQDVSDITPPTVTSIVRAGASPTSAASVNFTVTFSEAVTGVSTTAPFNDFELFTSGDVTGAAITGVSGSGSVYTVTVNTGSGDGSIRLDIPSGASITDLASNSITGLPYTSGAVYTTTKPPAAAILTAPKNAIGAEYNPTYTWDKVATATYYHLSVSGPSGLVTDQWFTSSSICDATTCSATPGPSATLAGGTYSWYVQTYNPIGYGPWSNNTQPTTFSTTALTTPAAAVLTAPVGSIGADYNPNYTWPKVTGATYYHLYVSGPGGVVLDQWYPSASICPATTCSVKSPVLAGGNYAWYVQTYNPVGYGPWSNNTQPTNFSVTMPSVPAAAVLTAPKNDIGFVYYPTYAWDRVATATYYHLYVSGPSGVVLDQWYQASNICDATTCSVESPVLGGGAHGWYVQTYNAAGYGPWSNNTQPTNFNTTNTPPAAAVLTAPVGGIGTEYAPNYTWTDVDGASYYHLYVSGPSGVVLDKWYYYGDICDSNPPYTCSVASPVLGGGAHVWYVQTYGRAGYGPWSNNTQPTNFSTTMPSVPAAAVLTAPKNAIGTDYNPIYTWDKVATATYYHLSVSGPSGVVLDQWYSMSSICKATTCSVSSPILGGGAHVWYVQTYNAAGYGPWSNNTQPTNFSTTIPGIPAGATLAAPSGTIALNTPTYTWDRVSMATWYRLYVKGPGGVVKDQWYQASSVCDMTTCLVVSPTLESGFHTWWVQTYNSAGYGPWKSSTFTVSP